MRKLMLETLAAGLALAAVFGPACAAVHSGANAVSAIASRGDAVSANGELKLQSAFNQREAGVPRAVFFNQREAGVPRASSSTSAEAGVPRAVLVAAGGALVREIPTVQDGDPGSS